jgi:cyclic dehypoxanthinyl futalosine synthase
MGITRQQALDCFASDDLIGIGMEADAIRRALHPEGVVTYTLGADPALEAESTATMTIGQGESVEQRIEQFEKLRVEQQETGVFHAFRLITSSALAPDDPTAVEYLKTLAVSRLYLDNIPNIEASLDTQGLKVLQMTLRFGANDAGVINETTEEDIRRVIRGAGFQPIQRDTSYRTMFLN